MTYMALSNSGRSSV